MGLVQFTCPDCKKNVLVDAKYVGLTMACMNCLKTITVPIQAAPWVPPDQIGPPKTPDGLPYKRCPFCTEYVSPHARQCEHCGHKLDVELPRTSWNIGEGGPLNCRLAVASLILGLFPVILYMVEGYLALVHARSLVLGLFPGPLLPSVLAILFGHMGMRKIKKSPVLYKGMGYAVWGTFFGYLFTFIYLIILIVWKFGP
jgi:hypothetical protein